MPRNQACAVRSCLEVMFLALLTLMSIAIGGTYNFFLEREDNTVFARLLPAVTRRRRAITACGAPFRPVTEEKTQGE